MVRLLKEIKAKLNKTVKYIRCDDASENKSIEMKCKDEGIGIQFEYTGPGMPQRNGRVERKLATLYGRVRAMFNQSGMDKEMRTGTWTECANTAQNNDNILVTTNNRSHRIEECLRKIRRMLEI